MPNIFSAIGDIKSDSVRNSNVSQEQTSDMYTFAQVDVTYRVKMGRLHLPVAGSSQGGQAGGSRSTSYIPGTVSSFNDFSSDSQTSNIESVVIPIHKGLAKREVRLALERVGKEPATPQPIDFSDNGIDYSLLEYWTQPKAPKLAPDGDTYLFSVDAYYCYALSRIPQPGESLRVASLPWDTTKVADNAYAGTNQQQGIV